MMKPLRVSRVFWRMVKSRWKHVLFLIIIGFGFSFLRISFFVATNNDSVHPITYSDASAQAHHEIGNDVGWRKKAVQWKQKGGGPLEGRIIKQKKDCPLLERPKESRIKIRNGYWQMQQEDSGKIYVWSAYYDDRPIVGLLPVIRAHVVHNVKRDVFCHVWYSGFDAPYVTQAIVTSTGRGEVIGGVKYKQDLYSCQLVTSQPIPSHLSFATSSCRNSTIYLEITVPVRAHWDHEFGVCVAIAFGQIPTVDFVEWMELNRLFGVTEFNIYDGNISANMTSVFDYYVNKGWLRVFSMPPPVADFSVKGVKLSSPASLNDCMLRNMYRYRYIVVIDFDEVIVPRLHQNYTELLKTIDHQVRLSESSPSYTFRNAYFFLEFPVDETQPRYLKTLRRRYRAPPSGYLFTPKSFVDPRTCLSVFNHYCWKRFTMPTKRWTIDVNTSLALTHHYRKCSFGKKKCKAFAEQRVLDNATLSYKRELDVNVRATLKNLHYDVKL